MVSGWGTAVRCLGEMVVERRTRRGAAVEDAVGCSPALCGKVQAMSVDHSEAAEQKAWPHRLPAGCVDLAVGSN